MGDANSGFKKPAPRKKPSALLKKPIYLTAEGELENDGDFHADSSNIIAEGMSEGPRAVVNRGFYEPAPVLATLTRGTPVTLAITGPSRSYALDKTNLQRKTTSSFTSVSKGENPLFCFGGAPCAW